MRMRLSTLIVSFIVLAARGVLAQVPVSVETAALSWLRADSAASCPSEADVTQAIEQRLGQAALVPRERASLLTEARLEAVSSGGFRVEIALVRGETLVGRRELESAEASCQGVAESAALVIALTIDPEASIASLPIAVSTAPPAAPPANAPPPSPAPQVVERGGEPTPVTKPAPAASPPWQGDLELGGAVATGTVPRVAAGLRLRGRALPPKLPFGFEIGGAYFPEKRLEASPGKGGDFTAFYLGAGLCSRPSRASRLSASFCAGAEVGALAGQGDGFASTPKFRTWTFALAARGSLWFRVVPPLAIALGPTFALPLKRDFFETRTSGGTETLFRMSSVGLGFDLGVIWEL
jgi:hypothetical protein